MSQKQNLQLQKFVMSSIKDDKVVVLVGKRETGKSFLCKDLLFYHQNIPVGTVISATEGANQFYGKIIPPLFIHDEYNENIIINVLKRQKKVVDLMNKETECYGKSRTDPRAFLILDDCLYDNSWTKSKYVRSLFMNGRHYKIMFIITMQYALGIPPNLRTNIDYVFILRENIVSNRKRLYESYAGMFPTFEVFCQVMDQCTANFECLVVNNNSKSNRLDEQVYWYKADGHNDFQMGARLFWKHHSDHFNDKYDNNESENYDPANRKIRGPLINVRKRGDFL
jgi:hypothetical protein